MKGVTARCPKCGHSWHVRGPSLPHKCPKCGLKASGVNIVHGDSQVVAAKNRKPGCAQRAGAGCLLIFVALLLIAIFAPKRDRSESPVPAPTPTPSTVLPASGLLPVPQPAPDVTPASKPDSLPIPCLLISWERDDSVIQAPVPAPTRRGSALIGIALTLESQGYPDVLLNPFFFSLEAGGVTSQPAPAPVLPPFPPCHLTDSSKLQVALAFEVADPSQRLVLVFKPVSPMQVVYRSQEEARLAEMRRREDEERARRAESAARLRAAEEAARSRVPEPPSTSPPSPPIRWPEPSGNSPVCGALTKEGGT